MKKYFSYLMLALAAVFTACEDVPEPYGINLSKSSGQLVGGQVLNESFAKSAGSFKTQTVTGSYPWSFTSQGGGCMKATSYADNTNYATDTYLVSPAIQLEEEAYHVTFNYILRYAQDATMKENHTVLISSDYNENPATATWVKLDYSPVQGSDWNTWADADLAIPEAYQGKTIYLAFRYIGTTEKAATWEVKNVIVAKGTPGEDTPVVGTEITCAEAVAIANDLADGATSTETYTITGYITEVVGSVSKDQQTFWMADTKDGGRVFEAYWANLPEGVSQFTAGTKVKITGQILKYVNKSTGAVTPEIKNATVTILEDSGDTPTPTPSGIEVTCAEAVTIANALADGATSEDTYTVTGYITEVVGNVSKDQQTFWMADTKDGGRVFEAYWADLPEGVTQFTAGTKVKITGQILKYVNKSTGAVTPEIKNASVVIIEEGGGDTPTPAPSGTAVTCAEAVTIANALADGGTSTETYSVTGYITEVVGSVSKNQQTFWMADTKDGGRVFEAYWADLPDGVSQFTAGAKVTITGLIMKYVNKNTGAVTPEIKNASVVILEEGGDDPSGGGDNPTPGDDPTGDPLANFTNGGFETWSDGVPAGWTTTSTICNATLSQDRDSHSGDYAVRVAGDSKNNKRLGCTEMTLPAGTYNCSFWVKSASGDAASICPGHAVAGSTITYVYDKGTDGKNRYINDVASTWQQVTYSFTLDAEKKVSVIIMNSKTPGIDILVDDFTITKQ